MCANRIIRIVDIDEILAGDLGIRLSLERKDVIDPDKLAAFCEKLGVLVTEDNIAMILYEDRIWEVDLENGRVTVKSRWIERRGASVCLEWDKKTSFQGYSESFNHEEMLILSKVFAIFSDKLPWDVKYSVERFLRNNDAHKCIYPFFRVPSRSRRTVHAREIRNMLREGPDC